MTQTPTTRPPAPPQAAGAGAARRPDGVTALLSRWFTAGLLLDAWAHNNLPGLESFFTPWHAVFYSGFAATAAWLAWVVRGPLLAAVRGPGTLRERWDGVPSAYRTALLAAAAFGVAGVGDMVWHTVLGIEQAIRILFSPTHLALATAMVLIVSTPLRTARADDGLGPDPGLRRLLPAVAGLALATAQVLLFVQYGNALVRRGEGYLVAFGYTDTLFTAWVLSSVVLTTLVLVVPLLHLATLWRLPPGAVTVLFGACGALSLAVAGGANRVTVATVLVAGMLCDVAVRWLRPGPDRRRAVLALGALVPGVTWTLVVAVAVLTRSPGDRAGTAPLQLELVLGMPVVQALVGLLAAHVMTAGRVGSPRVGG
ncbi:MAG: hypothetical protein HY830_22495 [Actinobacteria bacterium]|nr:hypothetical protein [Actinomycetota bacterium]